MNNDLYSLSKRIAAQYDAVQRVVDRMNWHSKIIQPSIDIRLLLWFSSKGRGFYLICTQCKEHFRCVSNFRKEPLPEHQY